LIQSLLLEPIYEIEVIVPEAFMGDVMGDISSRRGKISGMDTAGKMGNKADCSAFRTARLRHKASLLHREEIFKRRFSHYEEVLKIESKIVSKPERKRRSARINQLKLLELKLRIV
jgi:elongation factor G